MPDIKYQLETNLTAQEFQDILTSSTLSARRPASDLPRLQKMIDNADIIMTARDNDKLGGKLVGISRAITDYSYCCYLSDLAVDKTYQKHGIGKRLIAETHKVAGENTSLILLSAPDAQEYYPKIGMQKVENGWIIPKKE